VKLLSILAHPPVNLWDMIAKHAGLGSVASTVGILAAVERELIEITNTWSWPGVALGISMAVGVLSIIKLRYDIKKSKSDIKKSDLEQKLIQIKIDAECKEKTAR